MENGMKIGLDLPPEDFDLDAVFGCGQCFRWERREDGSYAGVAFSKELVVRREGGRIVLDNVSADDFEGIWRRYFDLDRDYRVLRRRLSADPVLRAAIDFAPGIRILRQDPWETLCSFILSQNNNIPRIRGIVARLCACFGERLPGGGYAFPPPEKLAGCGPDAFAPLRAGFRAPYLLDAARKVASGAVDLGALDGMDLAAARASLMTIRGVGPKVADCVLLFGCGRLESFPIDVWMKRVLGACYACGFPKALWPYGGVAQQYLFYCARLCPERLGAAGIRPAV